MNVELTEEQKIKVLNSFDIYKVMQQILMRENKIEQELEHFWTVGLSFKNRIVYIELMSLGNGNMIIIKPMQVFKLAIYKGAARMILVHNHPSNELTPSDADKDITDRMIQVGNIVDIEVIDHMIITPEEFYSFSDSGLLADLRLSKKWVPRFQEEERIRKEALKIGKKEGLKEGLKEGRKEGKSVGIEAGIKKVAKKMIKDGESINKIVKYTGLSKEEIDKL